MKIRSRSKIEQTAENGQEIAGDEYAAGIASLVPDVKNLSLRIGLEFDWA